MGVESSAGKSGPGRQIQPGVEGSAVYRMNTAPGGLSAGGEGHYALGRQRLREAVVVDGGLRSLFLLARTEVRHPIEIEKDIKIANDKRVRNLRSSIFDDDSFTPLYLWTSQYGGCRDISDNLARGLRNKGHLVECRRGEGHISVQDRSIDPRNPIIVDGSYLQFFDCEVQHGMPEIFVGTAEAMGALVDQYKGIGISSLQEPNGVQKFVDAIYRLATPFEVPPEVQIARKPPGHNI